jgi:hypothetical protein
MSAPGLIMADNEGNLCPTSPNGTLRQAYLPCHHSTFKIRFSSSTTSLRDPEEPDSIPTGRDTWHEDIWAKGTYIRQALWDFYDTLLDVTRHRYIVEYIMENMSQRDKMLLCNLSDIINSSGTPAIRHFLYGCREGNVAEERYTVVTERLFRRMPCVTKEDLLQLVVCASDKSMY